MNVLILGGTHFIGRHIAETLYESGHRVTIFNRGATQDELPGAIERLRGDRDRGEAGIDALRDHPWDVCIDVCGYTPRQVRPSAERLNSRVRRYVFVSAVAVYGDPQDRPVSESHARVEPAGDDVTEVVGEMYARLKVTCEDIVQQTYGDRCTILRPQIVVGPHDSSGRYAFWIHRAAHVRAQGRSVDGTAESRASMLAPGDGNDHLQVIDVRDIARFANVIVERDIGGVFNLAGPRITWREFINALGISNPSWVSSSILATASVGEFELPLFRAERGPRSGLMHVDNRRALAAGLALTDPLRTLRDMNEWIEASGQPPPTTIDAERPLLSIEREIELIQAVSQSDRETIG